MSACATDMANKGQHDSSVHSHFNAGYSGQCYLLLLWLPNRQNLDREIGQSLCIIAGLSLSCPVLALEADTTKAVKCHRDGQIPICRLTTVAGLAIHTGSRPCLPLMPARMLLTRC